MFTGLLASVPFCDLANEYLVRVREAIEKELDSVAAVPAAGATTEEGSEEDQPESAPTSDEGTVREPRVCVLF